MSDGSKSLHNPALVFVLNILISVYTFLHICQCGLVCGLEPFIMRILLAGYWINVGLVCLSILKPRMHIFGSPIKSWALGYSYLFFLAPVTQLFFGLIHMAKVH